MKKILLILNAEAVRLYLINTAIRLAGATSSFLHVVLTNDALDLEEYSYPFPNDLSLTMNSYTGKKIAEENAWLVKTNLELLLHACQGAKINFYIDPDREITIEKLVEYSAFADFILADADEGLQQRPIHHLLVNAHCPVFLSSKAVEKPGNIVFTYDGSPSSMYAIKAFTYLFPQYKHIAAALLHVTATEGSSLPNEMHLTSWLKAHYPDINIQIVCGNLQQELVSYAASVHNPLVVMGSYGRSAVSRLFHKSVASALIEERNASIFIAHD